MKNNLLKTLEQNYSNVNFSLSLKETVDWLKSKNLQNHVYIYTVKNKQILIKDLNDNIIDVGINGHSYQLKLSLSIILEKNPHFETVFLFWRYDNLIPDIVNYPIFAVANVPKLGAHNPLIFHDCLYEVPTFIEMSKKQESFEEKKKVAYARVGITGIHKHLFRKDNWFNHFKIKFSLFSHMFPDKCDFKLFFVPESERQERLGEMKDIVDLLPIYGQSWEQWTQIDFQELWKDQLKTQINLLCEGHSSVSHARYLMSLYNDGHIIKIGPSDHVGLIDLMVNSCDYPLVNAVCEHANSHFLKEIDKLVDNSSNLKDRNEFVMSHFSQDYLSDVLYNMFMLYNQFVKI